MADIASQHGWIMHPVLRRGSGDAWTTRRFNSGRGNELRPVVAFGARQVGATGPPPSTTHDRPGAAGTQEPSVKAPDLAEKEIEMRKYPTQTWIVGEWEFREFLKHGIKSYEGKPLYDFLVDGEESPSREVYVSLEHAMVAAVGEKFTGPRGAGGPGVGTAVDWFMKMIDAPTTVDTE